MEALFKLPWLELLLAILDALEVTGGAEERTVPNCVVGGRFLTYSLVYEVLGIAPSA